MEGEALKEQQSQFTINSNNEFVIKKPIRLVPPPITPDGREWIVKNDKIHQFRSKV